MENQTRTSPSPDIKMPRVVHVIFQFSPIIGGTENQALLLTSRLCGEGLEVRVLAGRIGDMKRADIINGVPVIRLACLRFRKGLRRVGKYVFVLHLFFYLIKQRHSYDLIHLHGFSFPSLGVFMASKLLKKKTLVKIANSGSKSDMKTFVDSLVGGKYTAKMLLNSFSALVSICTPIKTDLLNFGCDQNKIISIPNGLDLTMINSRGHNDGAGRSRNIVVISVGNLNPKKGIDILLQAWSKLKTETRNDASLVIIGEGPEKESLYQLVAEMDIKGVEFLGKLEREQTLLKMKEADLFVLPSRAEGLSNALLEAQSLGLPCIATSVGGNSELIADAKCGKLVPPEDPGALSSAIEGSLVDLENMQISAKTSAARVQERYSMNKIATRYIELYERIISGGQINSGPLNMQETL